MTVSIKNMQSQNCVSMRSHMFKDDDEWAKMAQRMVSLILVVSIFHTIRITQRERDMGLVGMAHF
jgi:hypothetical protein